jgi:hypothetical protein
MFQVFLMLFGIVVIGISLAHLAIGPEAIIGGADVNSTSDGEDRFFAGLFLLLRGGAGVVRTRCATQAPVRDPARRRVVHRRDRAVLGGGFRRRTAPVLRRDVWRWSWGCRR